MVVNFRAREISRCVHKLVRTTTLIKKILFYHVNLEKKKPLARGLFRID